MIASMATALYYIFMEHSAVDPVAIGRKVVKLLGGGKHHTMEVRNRLGHSSHKYALSDYGFSGDDIKRDSADYIQRYAIPDES